MAKTKIVRTLEPAKESQIKTEAEHSSKFTEVATATRKKKETGRSYPLVGFTIAPEDLKIFDELIVHLTVKRGRGVSKSALQRALIRLGNKHRDELEIEE